MKRRRYATCGNRIEVKFASLCDYMQAMWVTPIYGIPGSTTDPNLKIHRDSEPEVMCNGRPISFED